MTPSPVDTSGDPNAARLLGRAQAPRWIALIIILLAYILRAYQIDGQSLWSDEGISLLRASQPMADLWHTMPVEHVPGYFLVLHLWIRITGQSDFALRTLSLLPSVFAVALIMRTGRDLGNTRIALLAGALLGTSAFQVWYAQEVRMYSWLLSAGLFSTWCLWLMFSRPPSIAVWIGYVLSTAATVYLHYFGFLVPMVHTLVAVLWLAIRRDVQLLLRWVAAGATVALLFLPWATRTTDLLGFQGWRAPIDPNRIPWLLLQAYTAGNTMPSLWAQWVPVAYLVLLVLGAVAWIGYRRDAGIFLVTIAVSALSLTWLLVVRQPDFHERYTIFLSAPLTLLAAAGIAGLDPAWWRSQASGAERRHTPAVSGFIRALPFLALAGLIAANCVALSHLYFDASVQKPDYRAAAAHIEANVRDGDIVLVDGPNPELVFDHYYTGPAQVFDLRLLEGMSDAEVDEAMRTMTDGARRAWELLYFKPPGPVQVWLATRGWTASPTYHNNIRVQLIGLDDGPRTERPIHLAFGDALELVSSDFDAGPHLPGDLLRLSTEWFVHERAPEYKFSLRLIDEAGAEVQAEDYVPQNWFAPTNVWVVGQPARDQRGLILANDLAPGSYRVTLRLYDPYSGIPVETAVGIDVPIAEIRVE